MAALRFLTVLLLIVYLTKFEMKTLEKKEEYDEYDENSEFYADTSFLDDLDLTQFEDPEKIVSVLTNIEHAKGIFSSVEYMLNTDGQSDYNDELEGAIATLDQLKEKILNNGDSVSDEIEDFAEVIQDTQENISEIHSKLDADSDSAEYLSEALSVLNELLKAQSSEGNLFI